MNALGEAHVRSISSLRRFPNIAVETIPIIIIMITVFLKRKIVSLETILSAHSNAGLTDDGLLSPIEGRPPSTSFFCASLLQAIDGFKPLDLRPQVVSQAPQHFRYSETQATCGGCFAHQSIRSLRHVQSSTSAGVFESACRTLPMQFFFFFFFLVCEDDGMCDLTVTP